VGAGGFGTVYKAKDKQTNTFVALKVLFNIQDGLKEIEVLRQAGEHSNIVKFLDCYMLNNNIHLVFEFSPLGNLFNNAKKLRETGSLTEAVIVKWMY